MTDVIANVTYLEKEQFQREVQRREKIEEQAIKDNLEVFELLQQQNNKLKSQVESIEKQRMSEKSAFVSLVETLRQAYGSLKQRINDEKKNFEEEICFLRKVISEKESQLKQDAGLKQAREPF